MAFSHQKFTFLILCFITSLIVQAQRQQLNSIGRNVIPRPPGPPKDLPGGGKLEIGKIRIFTNINIYIFFLNYRRTTGSTREYPKKI